MLDTSIQVKTDIFDGPLSLLVLLIKKEEMDIKELDLTKITKEYLDYLTNMEKLNFDVAGDYLYLAATLLLLKSQSVLTETDKKTLEELTDSPLDISSKAELIKRLEELSHFQKMAEKLWSLPKMGYEIFLRPKPNKKEIVNSILTPIDLEKLTTSMVELIKRENRKFAVVRRDRLSIKEKLIFLKEYLNQGERKTFDEIVKVHEMEKDSEIINIVITFISLLELARLKKLTIFQNQTYGQIYVDVLDSLSNFDIDSADGFEEEEAKAEADKEERPEGIPLQ
ncbi:MAG: segregation and condensation protein A [Bacteriovoracaceae bacterium]